MRICAAGAISKTKKQSSPDNTANINCNHNSFQKFTLTIFIIVALSASIYAQSKIEILKDIRKEFKSINSNASLTKLSLENEDFLENMTDGGAELIGFYKDDTIVKIIEWIGISNGNRTMEYYFKNNQLFFAFEKFESFVQTKDGLDRTKTKATYEARYYFHNTILIEQRITGKRTFEHKADHIVKELQASSMNNIKLLAKKRKSNHSQ